MPQSLHSLLLARNALHSIKDYNLVETTGHQPAAEKLHETIPDVRSYNNYSIHEQPFDEKEVELFGNSVMMYGDLSEPAHGCLLVSKEHLIQGSNRFDQAEIEISDDIYAHSAPLVCSPNAGGDLISLKLENESLKLLLHQQRQTESLCQEEKKCLNLEIASLGHQINHSHQQSLAAAEELIISRASYNDLQLKVVELENFRMTFAIDKSEHNACLKRLSSENGHLKAAQRDISAISLTTEKKIAALESSKEALLEQVEELERQMSEKNVKANMTLESLSAAQTYISQLDVENVLLRQLRVDLDSSSKDCTLLRRQVSTLEAELTKYRSNGTQIQPNMIGNSGQIWEAHTTNNPQSLRQSFQPLLDHTGRRADPTVRLEAPDEQDRDRDRGQRLSRHLTPSMVLRDSGNYPQEQQSVVKRSNGSTCSSSSGAPLSSFISPSAHLQRRASDIRGEGDFDTLSYPPSSGEASLKDLDLDNRKVLPLYPIQQSLSLAAIVGIRRSSATSLDPSLIPNQTQRSSLGALISPPARCSSSSSSIGNRDEEQYRMEGPVSNVHHSNTMTIPSLQVSRRCNVHESGSYRGSGGGVSSFYDDLEPSAGPPIAPFGTSQSVLSSMAVYDETDRHLTALMTEKASLNEESSRLLQRGGKVLRERTRIQHIDARLDEIGKEIAHERKKLSGKPG